MDESPGEGCPARPVRRKELAEALHLRRIDRRDPRFRINKQSSVPA